MSLALAASPFGIGPAPGDGAAAPGIEYVTADGTIPASAGIALIRAEPAGELAVEIAGGGAGSAQRQLYVRNAGTQKASLTADNSGLIDGAAELVLEPGQLRLLAYDGVGSWHTASGSK